MMDDNVHVKFFIPFNIPIHHEQELSLWAIKKSLRARKTKLFIRSARMRDDDKRCKIYDFSGDFWVRADDKKMLRGEKIVSASRDFIFQTELSLSCRHKKFNSTFWLLAVECNIFLLLCKFEFQVMLQFVISFCAKFTRIVS